MLSSWHVSRVKYFPLTSVSPQRPLRSSCFWRLFSVPRQQFPSALTTRSSVLFECNTFFPSSLLLPELLQESFPKIYSAGFILAAVLARGLATKQGKKTPQRFILRYLGSPVCQNPMMNPAASLSRAGGCCPVLRVYGETYRVLLGSAHSACCPSTQDRGNGLEIKRE